MRSYIEFLILWLSMLISTTGTFVLQVTLSAETFQATSSGLLSSLIFTAPWILPVALAPLVSHLGTNFKPRTLLVGTELISGLLMALISYFGTHNAPALLAILLGRGLLEAIAKSSRVVALKTHLEPKHVGKLSGVYNTSLLLGNGIGGMIAAFLPTSVTTESVSLYSGLAVILSSTLCLFLKNISSNRTTVSLRQIARYAVDWTYWFQGLAILREKGLSLYFFILVCSVAIFQSFHTVARTAIPVGVFKGDTRSVGMTQVATCIGLVAGALIASRIFSRDRNYRLSNGFLFVTSFLIFLPVLVPTLFISNITYLLFMTSFEICWVICNTNIIVKSPKESIALVSAFIQPATLLVLIFGSSIFGFLLDGIGIIYSSLFAACLGISAVLIVKRRVVRRLKVEKGVLQA